MNAIKYYQSPIGLLKIEAENNAITTLCLSAKTDKNNTKNNDKSSNSTEEKVLEQCCNQLDEYFAGSRKDFELPLQPKGTAFQQKTWDQLLKIPYGETISYARLAIRVGNSKASRAVGSANGKNPIAIIIPCHRVINSSGSLGGYAYGLDVKRKLLDLEQKYSPKKTLF